MAEVGGIIGFLSRQDVQSCLHHPPAFTHSRPELPGSKDNQHEQNEEGNAQHPAPRKSVTP